MTGAWAALPPEANSAGFWLGPGAESFLASAAELAALAASIIENLGGHSAVAAAMGAAWPDPTGEFAVLANVPHLLWQATVAGLISEAAAMIESTGTAFETLKAATPTPIEVTENQIEHGVLQANNFLGMLFPAITANRANYGRMWITAADNKYSYAAASAAGVQSIPPLPPPPPATAGSIPDPTSMVQTPTGKSTDALASGGGGLDSALGMFMSPVSQIGSQLGQLGGGGGPMQGLMSLPQQMLSPLQSMMSTIGNPSGVASSTGAEWLGATPAAGGPVTASLTAGGGGGAGMGGLGALRGPTGWASTPTINAAAPAGSESAAVSRIGEAKAASAVPASNAGMGGAGGMMAPMGHGSGEQGKTDTRERRADPLTSLAALYRAPVGVPVITGSGGAVFQPREGAGAHTT
ncbi:PPE domain-containing protein [Mycobacterium sp. TY815]|uniref:PPE domain-containing protein n=1 Tax=Mycobacterium sp. TY815 TaxID=3050581 RepID=UPI0027405CE5|nr:PPE domain-containing protein [Mycobacterium sp. TY815]MDP7707380.1 PPE domain-containing protein [Mycobacterium sp. TY815]